MPPITIVGASGRQGMAQVRQALRAGYEVRALSRQADPFAGSDIEGIEGIDVRPIDLYDTESYRPALEGSDYIFYTHPLQARADRAILVGQIGTAAAALGVKRVVGTHRAGSRTSRVTHMPTRATRPASMHCGVPVRRAPCSDRSCSWTIC
ncbi:MAG: NAD(P)H-binding protein [Sphingomonadales bacterium]|nr:NAD(P)H-binding protein [Sphingomonadales bacterium]